MSQRIYANKQEKKRAAHAREKAKDPAGWRLANRRRSLLHDYGMRLEDYDRHLKNQNGLCAICLRPETTLRYGLVKELDIDHDHKTGEFRGLLCSRHNRMLGYAQDDPDILRAAADYLENFKKGSPLTGRGETT